MSTDILNAMLVCNELSKELYVFLGTAPQYRLDIVGRLSWF